LKVLVFLVRIQIPERENTANVASETTIDVEEVHGEINRIDNLGESIFFIILNPENYTIPFLSPKNFSNRIIIPGVFHVFEWSCAVRKQYHLQPF
jgi:hypothetical protein